MTLKDQVEDLGIIQLDHLEAEVNLEKSQGQYIFDDKTNSYFLDCFSYIASNPIGHNHPKMDNPEFEKTLLRVAKTNPSNSDLLTSEYVSFLKTFKEIAMPKEFKKAFFIAGGTLAVENALKTAFDWKIRKLHSRDVLSIPAEGLQVLHLKGAFSGRSGYSLSLTNTSPEKYKYFPKFHWPKFEPPLMSDRNIDVSRKIQDIESYVVSNKDRIAAIIIEPIIGEGGDQHFPPSFHFALRRLADDNECLLIYDEVQTGVGLTGSLWAYQNFKIVPDILAFGKKMQVCGIMVGDRVLSQSGNVFEEKSRINSTFGGNLVDMVRSQRYLQIIKEEGYVNNAKVVGQYFLKELLKVEKKNKKLISNTRGLGLMIAFDLPCTGAKDLILKKLFENKVIALGCGTKSVRVRPSLNFSKEDVNVFIERLNKSIKEL